MKKAMSVVVLAVVIVSALAGCPDFVVPPSDNDGGEPQQEMGKLIVNIQLYDPVAKVSISDYGDLLKRQIVSLNLFFDLQGDEKPLRQSFFAPVENGWCRTEIMIRPGIYDVWVEAIDVIGRILFFNKLDGFEVVRGENRLAVALIMNQNYLYRFTIPDLPGEYDEFGGAIITTNDGATYYIWFYPQIPDGGDTSTLMVFDAWLPLDFDGLASQAVLVIQDRNGESYVTELNFDIFDAVGGIMYLPYVYPEWMGDVIVDISFEYEQPTKPPVPVP